MAVVEDVESAAARAVAGVPRDQALGLRLMALARAAAGVHMAEIVATRGTEKLVLNEPTPSPSLWEGSRGTQAMGLRWMVETADRHGSGEPCHFVDGQFGGEESR